MNSKGGARSPSQMTALSWSPSKSVTSSDSGKIFGGTRHGKRLPLVDCPTCGIPVIKLRSKTKWNPNRIFYKCENNHQAQTECNGVTEKWHHAYPPKFQVYKRTLYKMDKHVRNSFFGRAKKVPRKIVIPVYRGCWRRPR